MNVLHFTPHGFCLAWDPGLIWLHAGSDLLIAAAYFSIPAALLSFLRRRRDLAFKTVFVLFAAFILACGMTHVFGAATLWAPVYWADGAMKAVTAALSVATAIMLWALIPQALALPSPVDLHQANAALAREVEQGLAAEAKLRESRTQLRQLYARSPAALHAVDAEGIIADVSDRWLDLVGYARDEVIGKPITRFYTGESAQASDDDLIQLRAGHAVQPVERRMVCRDGRICQVVIVLDVERDAAGRLQRVLASVTDVTAARETEAALRAAEERLRHTQKMEAVGQLTGGIAHDFNNLLTTVMGSLELLQRRSPLDERGMRLVENAMEGSRRAARLTSQLLSFSRRQRLAPAAVMPNTIVSGIHELLAGTLGDRISLRVLYESGEAAQWPLLADPNQMEAALLNLIINARDAIGGDDGQVGIAIGNRLIAMGRTSPASEAEALAAGDYVSITVTDSGSGMTEAVRSRAFEPFFTTKGVGAGTGLGLSQIYGFITQSGGAVAISSRPGEGASVEMLLPRAHGLPQQAVSASQGPATAAAQTFRQGSGERVLMVEDDDLLRRTMAEALESRGFTVIQAANGEEALALLKTHHVEVLFTDVRIPGALNGVDLARKLREEQPGCPVLFATGFAEAFELESWSAREDILAKPYTIEDAVSAIINRMPDRTEGRRDRFE